MKQEVPLEQAHRLLSPRPACLLSLRYKGQVNLMTIAWVCPVSLQPPLVAMAIHPGTYTHGMLARSEECVLNIPGRALAEQVMRCGTVSGQDEDKVALTKLELDSGRRVEAPWVVACLAHLECVVVDAVEPGDHTIYFAEVVGSWAEREAFDGAWLGADVDEELQPLCHLGGHTFCLLGTKVIPQGPADSESPEG